MVGGTIRAKGRIAAAFVALLVLVALLAAGGGGSAMARAPLVSLHKVGDFDQPVFVDNAPGAGDLLFVVEKQGTIAVLKDGHPVDHDFLNITSRVSSNGEQGLLSMAFDPHYDTNRRFYVYYVNKHCDGGACDIEVDGFRRSSASATQAVRTSRERVIRIPHHSQAGNHDGGQLQFGPDGHLYLAPGDGGTQGDPENDAQRKDRLLGKVLRIDPTAGGGHTVPQSNPFVGKPGLDEIFDLGLRNPFRFSFDRKTGDLWIGDVGGGQWEEIDRVTPQQSNGANFGWHYYEGPGPCSDCGFPDPTPLAHYRPPVHAYPHGSGIGEHGNVIIGGYVERDRDLPDLSGDYIYSDNSAGDLRAYSPSLDQMIQLGASVSAPSSFGEGRGGQLYVTSLGDGGVYRIDPA